MPASRNDIDVRRHLSGLVFHDEPLGEFVDWFMHALSGIEQSASDADMDLAWRIENRLAEYSGEHVEEGGDGARGTRRGPSRAGGRRVRPFVRGRRCIVDYATN